MILDPLSDYDYKRYTNRDFSPIHKMTAYLAMFPPNLPHHFIKEYSQKGDLVFDPFSGRGTTAFEACRMGRVGIGNDLNPLAFYLTKSKVNLPKYKGRVYGRILELENHYKTPKISHIADDIRMLYDEKLTLPQLEYLKNHLNPNNKIDGFILALLTGLMHGKHRKDGTSMYCSIDMPNTFSMSPNYVKNFIKKHRLKKISQNVFTLLRHRVDSMFAHSIKELQDLSAYHNGYAFNLDAKECSQKIIQKYGEHSINLIITSPPYLKNINYGKYNWIRLWLLDRDTKEVDRNVSIYQNVQKIKGIKDNLQFEAYAEYMAGLFKSWENILKPKAYAFVVIGDIETQNLAKDTWESAKRQGCKLKLQNILNDNIGSKKVTRIWGAKRGRATKIDRILVLQKD